MQMTETRAEPVPAAAAADQIITFPNGLVGCESWRHFVLMTEQEEDLPVGVLECLDQPETRLMVTNPKLLFADYSVSLNESERQLLDLPQGVEPVIYCTLSIMSEGWLTANLLGPLVINPETRVAKQIVLADSGYSTRHPVVRVGA
jgi:flagellar assembly factor FliW